jgi:hypothetical protein
MHSQFDPTRFEIRQMTRAEAEANLRALPLHELLIARGSLHGPYKRTDPYRGRGPVSRVVRAVAAFLLSPRAKL